MVKDSSLYEGIKAFKWKGLRCLNCSPLGEGFPNQLCRTAKHNRFLAGFVALKPALYDHSRQLSRPAVDSGPHKADM